MRNGLPIYAAGSDYNPDWEKEGVNSTLQNRDSRIVIFTKKPGDANTENKGDVNYYGDDGTPSYCSIRFIYGDKGSLATTGFIIKKANTTPVTWQMTIVREHQVVLFSVQQKPC